MNLANFCNVLEEQTGVPVGSQELRGGFPPKLLRLPADLYSATVASLGITPGDSLTVTRMAGAATREPAPTSAGVPVAHQQRPPLPQPEATACGAQGQQHVPAAAYGGTYSVDGMSEDEQLARAIAASLGQDLPPQPPPAPAAPVPANAAVQPQAAGAGPSSSSRSSATWAPLQDGTGVIRRKMADDNSCLFSAVGYATARDRRRVAHLRGMIAEAVLEDPIEWNEAVLQKEPAAYATWIRQPNTWGGAIELSILAARLRTEIAAFDTQTQRADVYGQGAGYEQRVFLIYDGLHYDALAVSKYPGAPEEQDVTAVPSSGVRTDAVMQAAAALVAEAHAARQFTDTANFTLRCGVCKQGLKGEKEAVAHAKATGHQSFTEY